METGLNLLVSGSEKNRKPTKAFTLAEVLITLVIIGTVSVMVIPSLVQKYKERVMVTKLKKFQVTMDTALKLTVAEYGEINQWGGAKFGDGTYDEDLEDNEIAARDEAYRLFLDRFSKHLKVIEKCYDRTLKSCSDIRTRYSLDGTVFDVFSNVIVLNNGTSIVSVTNLSQDCSLDRGSDRLFANICGQIFVDLNGKKSPNATGKDVFLFYYKKDGSVIPLGMRNSEKATFENYCNLTKVGRLNGYGCTAWVIENSNLDYLHCNDLNWDTKTSCKSQK